MNTDLLVSLLRPTVLRSAGLLLSVTLGAVACGPDADLAAPQLDQGWELTAAPVPTAIDPPPFQQATFAPTEADFEAYAAEAQQDSSWYSADGERYEALLVMPDGTSYGRKGEALGRGAPELPSEAEIAAGIAELEEPSVEKERIWTDTSIDNRSRISSTASLTSFPSRVIGALSGSGNTQSGGCSGAKVGPRHVLTAAHCVLKSDGTITTSGRFNPGQTNTTALNGSIPWSGVFLRDWRISRDYDYALLYLSDTAAVASTGAMGVHYWNSASGYSGRSATLRGYPCGPNNTSCGVTTVQKCAASPLASKQCDGWMYSHTVSMSGSTMNGNQLYVANDGSSGQSGSPIYGTVDGTPRIFGVYWGSNSGNNRGVRFRDSMWNDICSWIAQYPSSYVAHSVCH